MHLGGGSVQKVSFLFPEQKIFLNLATFNSHPRHDPLPSLQATLLAITALFPTSIFLIYSRNEELSADNPSLKLQGIEKINQIAKISSY